MSGTSALQQLPYDSDSGRWKLRDVGEIVLWDVKHAHLMPSYRKPYVDYEPRESIAGYHRLVSYTVKSAYEVHINYRAPCKFRMERPHVTSDTPGIRNEIWMGFIPEGGLGYDIHFGRTQLTNAVLKNLIIPDGSNGFRLKPQVASSWKQLEFPLYDVATNLRPHLELPVSIKPPQFPSEYKYDQFHPNRSAAYEAARKGRNAFLYAAAYVSFLLSFWYRPSQERSLERLASYLAKVAGMHKDYTTFLITWTVLGKFDIPRLGFTIGDHSPWLKYVPIFVDCGLPVSVSFGLEYGWKELRSVPAWDRVKPWFEDSHQLEPPSCSCNRCEDEYERHIRLPHQETPLEFIQRRKEEWLEHCQELGELPTLPGAANTEWYTYPIDKWAIYEWQFENGKWDRYPVHQILREDVFNAYHVSDRHFFPLLYEIDLYDPAKQNNSSSTVPMEPATSKNTSNAPKAPDSSLRISKYDLYSEDEDEAEEGELPGQQGLTSRSSHNTSSNNTTNNGPTHTFDEVKGILQRRLGFIFQSSFDPTEDTIKSFGPCNWLRVDAVGAQNAIRVLGLQPGNLVLSDLETRQCLFPLRALSNRDMRLSDLPTQFDIAGRDALSGLAAFQIEALRKCAFEKKLYVVGVKDKPLDKQWYVLVVDAYVLVEIVRNGWEGIGAIARELMNRCIEFSTARYYHASNSKPTVREVKELPGLGVLTGKTISPSAYRDYKLRRDEFLRGPRGGLALKAGGFVARMAKDVLSVKKGLAPPTDAAEHGRVLGSAQSGKIVIADYIEEHELDIILGRFLIVDNKGTNATLWPALGGWYKMGVNTGQWDECAEYFYQAKLAQYESGNDKGENLAPLTRSKWKSCGRQMGATRPVWEKYNHLCAEYLGCYFS